MTRCSCAVLKYRNNGDGTQDKKVVGKTGCVRCMSYGFTQTCSTCTGDGLLLGVRCPSCYGCGVVPDKRRQA